MARHHEKFDCMWGKLKTSTAIIQDTEGVSDEELVRYWLDNTHWKKTKTCKALGICNNSANLFVRDVVEGNEYNATSHGTARGALFMFMMGRPAVVTPHEDVQLVDYFQSHWLQSNQAFADEWSISYTCLRRFIRDVNTNGVATDRGTRKVRECLHAYMDETKDQHVYTPQELGEFFYTHWTRTMKEFHPPYTSLGPYFEGKVKMPRPLRKVLIEYVESDPPLAPPINHTDDEYLEMYVAWGGTSREFVELYGPGSWGTVCMYVRQWKAGESVKLSRVNRFMFARMAQDLTQHE